MVLPKSERINVVTKIGNNILSKLKNRDNKQLVAEVLEEIIDIHHRYRNFSAMTQEQAIQYIADNT